MPRTEEVGWVKLTLNEEETALVRRTLEARLGALRTEMTRTDSPEFSLELRREEEILERMLGRLRSAAPKRPARKPATRPSRRQRPRRP